MPHVQLHSAGPVLAKQTPFTEGPLRTPVYRHRPGCPSLRATQHLPSSSRVPRMPCYHNPQLSAEGRPETLSHGLSQPGEGSLAEAGSPRNAHRPAPHLHEEISEAVRFLGHGPAPHGSHAAALAPLGPELPCPRRLAQSCWGGFWAWHRETRETWPLSLHSRGAPGGCSPFPWPV